jgi:hypothetical protein
MLAPTRMLPDDPVRRFEKATLAITELYSRHLARGEPLVCRDWWVRFGTPLDRLSANHPLHGATGASGEDLARLVMAMPDLQRRQALLEVVHHLLIEWAMAGGWDVRPLQKAYDACLADGLQLVLISRPKSSPDRKRRAHLTFTIDGNGDGLSTLHVLDQAGDIVFQSEPQESRCEARHFPALERSVRWNDTNTVQFDPWVMITRRRFTIDDGRQSRLECLAGPPFTAENLGFGLIVARR